MDILRFHCPHLHSNNDALTLLDLHIPDTVILYIRCVSSLVSISDDTPLSHVETAQPARFRDVHPGCGQRATGAGRLHISVADGRYRVHAHRARSLGSEGGNGPRTLLPGLSHFLVSPPDSVVKTPECTLGKCALQLRGN